MIYHSRENEIFDNSLDSNDNFIHDAPGKDSFDFCNLQNFSL
jgi:hypothetical protein